MGAMSSQGPPPPPPPPPSPRRGAGPNNRPTRIDDGWPKWSLFVLLGLLMVVLVFLSVASRGSSNNVSYSTFMNQAKAGRVKSITFNNTNGHIDGKLKDGKSFTTTGFSAQFPPAD